VNRALNSLVRAYLRRFPVTEGKAWLLRATRSRILPGEDIQEAPTKFGFTLRLNLRNPEQERIYFYGEHDERYEIACLRRLIAPGMVCWDIGANIGFYACLLASLAGRGGKVVAFEPLSATRDILLHNLALNGMTNVQVVPCALGAADGEARIHFQEAALAEGTASIYPGAQQTRSEAIAIARLDTIAGTLPAPDFVKIDVEGAQEDVWRGGEAFFAAHAPLVMAELRESADPAKLAALQERIRSLGFRMFECLKGGRVRECSDLRASRKRNFLLAKPASDALRRLVYRP